MSSEFKRLKISLEDIQSATNKFGDDKRIGGGGFGKVYKGEVVLSSGLTIVAVKRLVRLDGIASDTEFWKEIMFLSGYKHQNLVSLVGFCDEAREKILVYEYASNNSLDLHLSSTHLSWVQRLHICIGAARGLQYLHHPQNTNLQRVIHRDIKSSNIMLDHNWNAKIADLGLSSLGPANQQSTFLVSNIAGTMGYIDPSYMETGLLTKESDVYSFGVVLFEILCGRLSLGMNRDVQPLPILAKKLYEEKKLDTLIFKPIKDQISPRCLEMFSDVAYQCLSEHRQERPTMASLVEKLQTALQFQVEYDNEKELGFDEEEPDWDGGDYWERKLPKDWRLMIYRFNIPRAIYTVKRELFTLLHKGIHFDEGNMFLWINIDGKKCVLISAKRFLELHEGFTHRWVLQPARFSIIANYLHGKWHKIRCQIKTSLLSLDTMYTASLVFKYSKKPIEDIKHLKLMTIKWETEELSVCSTHNAELTQDNWYKIRMWNFFNHVPNATFDIVIEELSYYDDPVESDLLIQGIEFQPIELIQHEEIKGIKGPAISELENIREEEEEEDDDDDDEYWEKKLPKDYQHYIQISDKPLHYANKKELYDLLCDGFLAYSAKLWSSLCKSTGGICSILPATQTLYKDTSYESLKNLSLSSRFRVVKELGVDDWYLFTCRFRPFMFSLHYIYACYLVFKFENNHKQSNDARYFKAEYKLGETIQGTVLAHLNVTPQVNIPTIKPKNDHDSPSTEGLGIAKGHIQHFANSWIEERSDGWMEVRLCKPLPHLENHNSLEIKLWKPKGASFGGIIVEGIEFRPMQDVSSY